MKERNEVTIFLSDKVTVATLDNIKVSARINSKSYAQLSKFSEPKECPYKGRRYEDVDPAAVRRESRCNVPVPQRSYNRTLGGCSLAGYLS